MSRSMVRRPAVVPGAPSRAVRVVVVVPADARRRAKVVTSSASPEMISCTQFNGRLAENLTRVSCETRRDGTKSR
jgi:hypothetical protein